MRSPMSSLAFLAVGCIRGMCECLAMSRGVTSLGLAGIRGEFFLDKIVQAD